jgi:hypothetical protein
MISVVTPATSRQLTTAAAVKAELGLSGSGDDAFIATLIDQASDAIAAWCGRVFGLETVRETLFDGTSRGAKTVSRFPVVSVSDCVDGSGTTVGTDLIEIDRLGFLYLLDDDGERTTWARGRTTITYTAGYLLPGEDDRNLPADIERAALSLVKGMWFARTRDPLIRSEDVDGILATSYQVGGFGASLPPDVQGLLMPYRPVVVI